MQDEKAEGGAETTTTTEEQAPARVRLSMMVDPEVKKAVEVLAKLNQSEFADVLRGRSLDQVVEDFRQIRQMVNEG